MRAGVSALLAARPVALRHLLRMTSEPYQHHLPMFAEKCSVCSLTSKAAFLPRSVVLRDYLRFRTLSVSPARVCGQFIRQTSKAASFRMYCSSTVPSDLLLTKRNISVLPSSSGDTSISLARLLVEVSTYFEGYFVYSSLEKKVGDKPRCLSCGFRNVLKLAACNYGVKTYFGPHFEATVLPNRQDDIQPSRCTSQSPLQLSLLGFCRSTSSGVLFQGPP